MKFRHFCLYLFLSFSLLSCGPVKRLFGGKNDTAQNEQQRNLPSERRENSRTTSRNYANPVEQYIATFAPVAQQEMLLYNIPASITLAQGILESGAGRSRLSVKANNHFGIKCHDWEGPSISHDDDRNNECFRKYKDAKYSYRDHSLFLTERKRYAFLFDLDIHNYKAWAKGLREAGYATDRKYPEKLINLIEKYQLYLYDDEVLGREGLVFNKRGNTSEKYVVQKGDTLYSISKLFNLTVEQIMEYNNLRSTNLAIGQVLFLEPIPNN